MEFDPQQIAVAMVALLVGGFLKGVTGMGLPLIITPPLVWIFGIHVAVPIVAITALVTNVVFIGKYHHAWKEVLRIWPMVVVGLAAIIVGVIFLRVVDARITAIILALLGILYVVLDTTGIKIQVKSENMPKFNVIMGGISGFFHGTTGISGPPVIMYLSSIKDFSREAYFQALGTIFLIFGMQQILGYTISGIYTIDMLKLGFLATVPVLISFFLGNKLQTRLDGAKFKNITLVIIFVSCVSLLINNLQ